MLREKGLTRKIHLVFGPSLTHDGEKRTQQLANFLRSAGMRTAILLLVSAFSLASAHGQSSPTSPTEAQIHFKRALAALKAGAPAMATKEFLRVLALDPRNAKAYADLGVVAFLQHDYSQALKYLSSALSIDPSLVKTQALLGLCEAKLGHPSARISLQRSFSKLQDRNLRTQVGMALASLYYRQGALGRAASVAQILVQLNPDNVNVLLMAQRIYSDLAYKTMNKLAVLAPGSAQMQVLIAEQLVNAGDLQGAIKHYRKALAIDPYLAGVHFELGEAIFQLAPHNTQNQAAAQKEFETAKRSEGDSASIECQLGKIALSQSNLADAYAHYHRALQMDPGSAEANLGLGNALLMEGKLHQAVTCLKTATRIDPLNADAYYHLGEAYQRLKLPEEAKKEFQLFQGIRRTRDRVKALYNEMHPPSKTTHRGETRESQAY